MTDQLIFKFPSNKAYIKDDFYVSSSNKEAYDFIVSWPKWIRRTANIFGPPGSGKTHLSSIFKKKTSTFRKEMAFHTPSMSVMREGGKYLYELSL